MRRIVAIALTGLAAAKLACSLPVEDKTACVTSVDCVDDRICHEGQCVPGACGPTCVEACDIIEECDLVATVGDCEGDCIAADGLLPGFGEEHCKRQWDALFVDDDECVAAQCLLDCRALCMYAGDDCTLIVDVPACIVGCQEAEDDCVRAVPTSCADVPAAVQCYESGSC